MAKDKKTTKVTAKDLRGKTESELMARLMELRKTSLNLRFKRLDGEFKNTAEIGKVKKEIALIKTVMTEQSKKEVKAKAAPKKKVAAKAKKEN